MAEQLQLRSGPYPIAPFAPAQAEVIVDTTYSRLCVGDGIATPGGWAAALETRKAVSDAAYSATGMDRLIAYTAITAARVVTLPAATAYPPGARLTIVDESGAGSAANTITVSPAGADKIDGQASVVINSSYGYVGMESNGSNSWTVIENGATIARAPHGGNAQFAIMEFTPPALSGPTVTYTPSITQNCIVFAVSVRVLTAISGCSSWDLGNSGASSTQYGSGLGLTVNTTNAGVAAPTPFFPAPTLTFTAVGGAASFSGNGTVRLSILLMFVNPPTA